MNGSDNKKSIEAALRGFASQSLVDAATHLFEVLGYVSRKRIALSPNNLSTFLATFADGKTLNEKYALPSEWKSIDFVFQLTDDEVVSAGGQTLLFESKDAYRGSVINSYLFLALELKGAAYTRTALSGITRELNKLFAMPALVLFRHGDTLTLAVINRRLHKRDESRDVLEKVTLIKDIAFADPLRAHLDILDDLSLRHLHDEFFFHNFVGLHQAWEKRLASYALNERFYREIANWYFWALTAKGVKLPRSVQGIRNRDERNKQRSIFFIRLLTRLIFCWFLQEKRLIPRDLFRSRVAEELLADFTPKAGTYYRAILQNLFFGTLNQEQENRGWRKKYKGSRDGNRGVTNLWRYNDLLTDSDRLETLLRDHIPFVNGGLFDCLDDVRDHQEHPNVRLDDFSEEKANELCLPNELFFGDERTADLSEGYEDEKHKKEKVRGLIEILSHYKFTVEENTPLEEEIALDPELLGKVFENLLASYNEDTGSTARKALGAFFTPREIVRYLVDNSLRSYLAAQVPSISEESLNALFADHVTVPILSISQRNALVKAIGRVKILDPACGSGAFPMGALHRLVDLLQKLDPNNEGWKRDRLAEAEQYYELLRSSNARKEELRECEARIEDIRQSFDTRFHALDFARKLYLIENCIYGVDIQPIACQIAKLRCFIALIVDQRVDRKAPNLGVRPLPNLETKIVAADSLMPINKPGRQLNLLDPELAPLRKQLEQVRHDHFSARTPARKAKCRERDAELRAQIAQFIEQSGMPAETAHKLAAWDPYDQNHAAPFFDSEWMFGIPVGEVKVDENAPTTLRGNFRFVNELSGQKELVGAGTIDSGFDIVIGNPPYVRIQTLKRQNPDLVAFYKADYKSAAKGNYDLYVVFVEAGLNFLKRDGHLAYILPHKFFNAQYGEPLRALIAKGHYLQHVVHFGDQQVFPGATNYVCLLFLAKAGSDSCRVVRVDDFQVWLQTFTGTSGTFPAATISHDDWNFAVGRGADVFERLMSLPTKLEHVTSRIFQGIKTSADRIYIVEEKGRTRRAVRVFSPQTGDEHDLEPDLLHPLIKGGDSKPYQLTTTNRLILFPYAANSDGAASLISTATFKKQYPLSWAYLLANRDYLEEREDGAMRGDLWYAYGRSQALDVMPLPKLFTPDISPTAAFSFDATGDVFFTGGVAGGYGILPLPTVRPEFLLGLLNSRVLDFYHHKVATQMRGGWFSYESRFIKNLPIAPSTELQDALIVRLVQWLLWLNRQPSIRIAAADSPQDPLIAAYFEQLVNALVYELYFPDELHAAGLRFFDVIVANSFPSVESKSEALADGLGRARQLLDRLSASGHPVRVALDQLQTLDLVRIVQGAT